MTKCVLIVHKQAINELMAGTVGWWLQTSILIGMRLSAVIKLNIRLMVGVSGER